MTQSQSMTARSEELMRLLGRTAAPAAPVPSSNLDPRNERRISSSGSSSGSDLDCRQNGASPPTVQQQQQKKKSGSVGSSSEEGGGERGGSSSSSAGGLTSDSSNGSSSVLMRDDEKRENSGNHLGTGGDGSRSTGKVGSTTSVSPVVMSANPGRHSGASSSTTTALSTSSAGTTTTAATTTKKKKKDKKRRVINISLCKYSVIARLAEEFGFTIDSDDEVENFNFTFIWADTVLPIQKLGKLQNWQRFNHFPSMHLLSRKVHLGVTLGRMRKVYSAHYAFYPRTWSLRSERSQFTKHFSTLPTRRKKGSTKGIFIMKPNCGSQGNGIIITRNPLEEVSDLENYIVQEYIAKPLLIEGKKFDLRVYVLVTSIRHFSAFLFNDGLVRMCAEDYVKPTDENMKNTCIHLTNYAVNKHSEQFVFNSDAEKGDVGNKRDFRFFNDWLVSQGHDPVQLWDRVEYMICKSFMAAQPQMSHVYNSCFGTNNNDGFTCFEVLGFDIMLDENLKPWLLEVNHTPSFNCDTPLDRRIKHSLLDEVWKIVDVANIDKSKQVEKDRLNALKRMTSATAGGVSSESATISGGPSSDQHHHQYDDGVPLDAAQIRQREIQEMVSDVRAREDKSLVNFRRIYPSPNNPQRQAVYEELNGAAKELTSVQTTACQEQRQNELKQEREKKQKEKERMMSANMGGGNKPPQPPPPPPPLPGSSSSTTGGGRSDSEPLSRKNTGGLGSARAVGGNMGTGSVHRRSSHDNVPPYSSSSSGSGTTVAVTSPIHHHWQGPPHPHTAPGDYSSASSSQPVRLGQDGSPLPHRPDHPSPRTNAKIVMTEQQQQQQDAALRRKQQQQERLNQQMERHRRRMVLGPRLSVFQLRESQMEAMLAAQQQQQQNQDGLEGASGGTNSKGAAVDSIPSLGVEIGGAAALARNQAGTNTGGGQHYQQDQQALAEYYAQLSVQNDPGARMQQRRTSGSGVIVDNNNQQQHQNFQVSTNESPLQRSDSFGRRGSTTQNPVRAGPPTGSSSVAVNGSSVNTQQQQQQQQSATTALIPARLERPQRRSGANNPQRTRSTSIKAGGAPGGGNRRQPHHTTTTSSATTTTGGQDQQQYQHRIPMMMMHEEANPYAYYQYDEEEEEE